MENFTEKNCPSYIIIFGGGFLLVVFLIALFAGALSTPSTTTNIKTQNAVVNNTAADLIKFANYHKQLVAIEKPLDEANDTYKKQSRIALKNNNLYALYNGARICMTLACKPFILYLR
jgi:hypothetical protein